MTSLLRCLWPKLGEGILGTSLCWDYRGHQATHRAGTPSPQMTSALWDESHPWLLKALSVSESWFFWQGVVAHSYKELWHHVVSSSLPQEHIAGRFPWAVPQISKIRQSSGAFSPALHFQAQASDPVADCWTFSPSCAFLVHAVPWCYRNVVVDGFSV